MRKDGIQTRKRKPKKNGSGNSAVELGLSKKDDKEGKAPTPSTECCFYYYYLFKLKTCRTGFSSQILHCVFRGFVNESLN